MSTVSQGLEQKIAEVLLRVEKLEMLQTAGEAEAGWRYLVARSHPWRRLLWIKGRNMTAAQLVSSMNANGLSVEQTAADFELPPEAVQEAVRYCRDQAELIALEASEERRRLLERHQITRTR
ncbi:MAG TPA: hypothetical protein VFI31_03000 [Pirellulales bacterium]|nr:hypothetical protein [Pirellulales bacterium]